MVEILFSFFVLFMIATYAVVAIDMYRRPLGFDYTDVWAISIQANSGRFAPAGPAANTSLQQVWRAIADRPEVVGVAAIVMTPWENASWNSFTEVDGRRVGYDVNMATDDLAELMSLRLVRGRWFDRSDDAANRQPVVISEALAMELFGTIDAVGKTFNQSPSYRVVGIINAFRRNGGFTGPEVTMSDNYLFQRLRIDDPKEAQHRSLLIKVRPGTTAAFEPVLLSRLHEAASHWTFEIRPLTEKRDDFKKFAMVFYITSGLIAGFLTLMVVMGLTGVVWQNVTQRMREMGLRRAKGATAVKIRNQILGELTLMTTFAVGFGVALMVQPPVLGVAGVLGYDLYAAGLAVSIVCIYLVTIVAGIYPSLLAMRVQPAEALRYE
jgi:putative ABC transport system permease protein